MHDLNLLLQIIIVLISTKILGELFSFFKLPPVIGELFAGILIGPTFLNIMNFSETIALLAEIGLILLLFEVGIDSDFHKLKASGKKSIAVALVGVALTFGLAFYTLFSFFSLPLLPSLFLSCSLTPTSIGITLKVLQNLKKQSSKEAQTVLGAAVLDDIIGVLILGILSGITLSNGINLLSIPKLLISISLFFIVSPLIVQLLCAAISRWVDKKRVEGLVPTLGISLILFFSWLAYLFKAPEALGGFVAGFSMSNTFFKKRTNLLFYDAIFVEKIKTEIKPITHLFVPFFFISIGASLDLSALELNSFYVLTLTLCLTLIALIGKFLSGFFTSRSSNFSKMIIGAGMIPRGEVGLIFCQNGLSANALSEKLYACGIIVIILSTLIGPIFLKLLYSTKKEKV